MNLPSPHWKGGEIIEEKLFYDLGRAGQPPRGLGAGHAESGFDRRQGLALCRVDKPRR